MNATLLAFTNLTAAGLTKGIYRVSTKMTFASCAGSFTQKHLFGLLVVVFIVLTFTLTVRGQCLDPSFNAVLNVEAGGSGSVRQETYGDINGDGRTDVVITVSSANMISVLLGQTSGKPTALQITSVQKPVAVGIGDFNHDGKADLAVSHGGFPNPTGVAILLGDGTGNFGPPTDFAGTPIEILLVADFNNDGNSDVFVGDRGTGSGRMLLGNGSGGLAAGFTVSLANATHVVAVDVNQDGKLDLAIEYDSLNFVWVALGDGTGHFGPSTSFPIPPFTGFGNIAAGDLNNDGKVDLVITGSSNGLVYLLGDGLGGFGAATAVTTGFGNAAAAVIADFNGDGNNDIATGGGINVTILLGNGSGTFALTKNYVLTDSVSYVVFGDFNGDNKPDVATICSGCPGEASFLLGDGSGNLKSALVLPG